MQIKTYTDLENLLENWTSFNGEGGYDYIGAIHLLGALLRNLNNNLIATDPDELDELLGNDEKQFLHSIVNKLDR